MTESRPAKSFDVCVVGHVTRDWIRTDGAERCGAGGVAYYSALALHRLGLRVAVVTRLARRDRDELLAELLGVGIDVNCGESVETSTFQCETSRSSPDDRSLTLSAVAQPFEPADLQGISARWFYLGPLTQRDMASGFIRAAGARGELALDAQGIVRQIDAGAVRLLRPPNVQSLLRHVSLLKVDEAEAAILSELEEPRASARRLHGYGPAEVVLTRGSKGSLVFVAGRFHVIDAVAGEIVDTTGCGDTYLAAYLARRIALEAPALAGRFAAAAAALVLEEVGAFRGSEALVRDRMG